MPELLGGAAGALVAGGDRLVLALVLGHGVMVLGAGLALFGMTIMSTTFLSHSVLSSRNSVFELFPA